MRKFIVLAAALAMAPFQTALSGYSLNISGTVNWVKIYNSEVIYFELSNQPAHCANRFFAISSTQQTSEKQRDRYYAMLLAARAAQTTVSVGYGTDAGDCVDGGVLVHALTF